MKRPSKHVIPFRGLKEGIHFFKFKIDNTFFEQLNFFDFFSVNLNLLVTLEKKASVLILKFEAKGYVNIPCDITIEPFNYNIDADFRLLVKFGNTENYDGDEMLTLPHGASQIDISQYIYEMVILVIPQKRVHPGVIDGSLRSDMIQKINALQPKKRKKEHKGIDPRWDKLKDLLLNKKTNGTSKKENIKNQEK